MSNNAVMRLGFAVKVVGTPLKSNDARRWQTNPHLRVSLGYLIEIFEYLRKHRIHMYRMSSDLAPYATHPDLPQFHSMVRDCAADLAHVGRLARAQDLRLSFHPSQYIVLNSGDAELTRKSVRDLESQAEMLDLMECGPEAVLVIHVGGVYGDSALARARWVTTWKSLGEPVRRRLVLENDDTRFSAADVLSIHEQTGVRLIFDHQHFFCLNPERLELLPTLGQFLRTWPRGCAAEASFFVSAHGNAGVEAKEPQNGKVGTGAAGSGVDRPCRLQQSFRDDLVSSFHSAAGC